MKSDKAFRAMEHIDSDLIDEAETCKGIKKTNGWIKWGAMAACLCLAAAGAWGASRHRGTTAVPSAGQSTSVAAVSPGSETQSAADAEEGIYIPAVELPDTAGGAELDMIAFVVYNGGIYTEAAGYYGADALKIEKLTGDYLGHASGTIDEWSKHEAYDEEFASSFVGEIYEVNGYDPGFRVCVKREAVDENGERELFIMFLDRLNGITLKTGDDLFEKRLRLRDRVTAVQWQSHGDWNACAGNLQTAGLDAGLWEQFLDRIDEGTVTDTWDPEKQVGTVYDTENQAHLFLTMEDGTAVELRLIEGGYVGYDPFGWYFVKIPGEVFDAVFSACGGTVRP